MCTIQERDRILEQPILKYSDIMELTGVGESYAYGIIEDIRYWMQEKGKPLPRGKRITSTAYRQYFEIQ